MKRLLFCLCATLVVVFLQADNTVRHLTVADGLSNNQLRQLMELPNGQILAATEGMFCLYNGKRFVPFSCNLDSVQQLPFFGCHHHLWQGDSLLWLKDFYSLYLFDVKSRQFRYDYDKYVNLSALQAFLNEDGSTVTHASLRALEEHRPLFDSLTAGTSLEGDQLQAWVKDRQGGQWFGTRSGGILYLRPTQQAVHLIKPENGDVVRRMMSLDRETMLVAGSTGIYVFDCRTERIINTLAQGHINCAEMQRDLHGRIWLATTQGIYCYDHGKIRVYDHTNTQGFLHDHMRFVLPIDENRLLVCNFMHDLGVFYPDEGRMEMLNERIPALSDYRTMIAATLLNNRNKAVVCTQNGCFVLDVSKLQMEPLAGVQQMERYSRKFNCVLLGKDGRLWLGTQNGLLMISGGKTKRFTQNDGLSNDCIQSLAEDAEGCLWVGTANGVNRIRMEGQHEEVRIRCIGPSDGLPALEMTERGICMMPDSTLYMGTAIGMVAIATKEFLPSVAPLNTVLVGLHVAGEAMPLDTLPLHLTYQQNYIDLQVSALNYAHPQQTSYRYRLMETGDHWQRTAGDDGYLASIRLDALSPGTYTIEVQASMGDHIWGTALRKTFVIAPPLWLTWWAKLLYVLLITALVCSLLWWYLRDRQKKMQRENEQRVNQLFELREQARHQFAESVKIDPEQIAVNSEEQQLLERVMKAVEQNIDNTDYTVDLLARDVGMSRANLYKKMQTMLGITPSDFMRNVRLKRAAQLLADSNLSVNQIALSVGFLTPRYFSQYFRKMFGVTPTEYRTGKTS